MGSKNKRPWISGIILCFVIVSMLFFSSFFASNIVQADWGAEVTTAPQRANQGVPFDYTVHFTNTGETTIHVKWVHLTIVWPAPNPPWGDLSERFGIFSGERNVTSGSSTDFVKEITSNSFGEFATNVSIMAIADGEVNSTVRYYSGGISLTAAPAPGIPSWLVFIAVFLVFFVISWGFFEWGKFWWRHEIENALKHKDPDLLLLWKWFPYYWENNGKMWRNFVLWSIFSAIIALVFTLNLGA